MDFKDAIRSSLAESDEVVNAYLGDITAEEMLVRPVASANHVAWQLGHLIGGERYLVEMAVPGSMPPLPDGFEARHSSEAATSDDARQFLSKEDYLNLARSQRRDTLRVLEQVPLKELARPISGEGIPPFIHNAGDAFVAIAQHWTGHAGQWVVLRRKLGRPRMF